MQSAKSNAKLIPISRMNSRVGQKYGIRAQKIVLHQSDYIEIILLNKIRCVIADGNYSKFLLLDNSEILSSKTLGHFENQLLAAGFIRPHQSFIVNTNCIQRIKKGSHLKLILDDSLEIPIARSKRKEILDSFISNS